MNDDRNPPARNHGREDLTGEHRLGDAGQLVFFFLFLGVWVVDSFVARGTVVFAGAAPAVRIPVGAAVLVAGVGTARASHGIVFGREAEKPRVIRDGVFDRLRHPMYFSEVLFYAGMLVFSLSLAAAAVALAAWGFLTFIARFEERLLLTRFGDEYARYMDEVPMWLPRLGRSRNG